MEISSIRRVSAADEAFKALHDMIMSGELKHGDKLPSQDKIAVQFGVSRNTIREAINKLTVMGLLTARQGVGTVINITSPSGYMASLSDHLLLQPTTVRDFLEARVIIEKATVRLAVMRADPIVVADLESNINKQRDALRKGNIKAFIELDIHFHITLAKSSGNQVLQQFLETVTELLGKFIKEVSLLPKATQHAFAFHKDILKCIRAGDAEGAERKVVEHLYDVAKNIEQSTGTLVIMEFPFNITKKDSKRRKD
jgi:GntR family transcriptional regulator, transcriptional repressor for pyruvate dehydrogenase complex